MVFEIAKALANKRARVYALAVLALNAPLMYTSISFYIIVREAGTGIASTPLTSFWKLLEPGDSWVPRVIDVIALLLVALIFYQSLRLKGLHWAIATYYILLALAVGLGPDLLTPRALLAAVVATILSLLSMSYRRVLHFIVTGRDWTVKYSVSKGSLPGSILYMTLTTLAPLLIAIGASLLVLSAASALEALELGLPPPLPDIWDLFKSTRIGVFLALLAVIWFSIWVTNNVFETIIMIATLRRVQALDLARNQALKEYAELSRFNSREDKINAWILSSIGALLIYPIIYANYAQLSEPLSRLLGETIVPRWLTYAAGLAALMIVLWTARRLVTNLTTARGLAGRRWTLFYASLTIITIIYLYATLGGETLSLMKGVVGLDETQSLRNDPLGSFLLSGNNLWIRLEILYSRIEGLLRMIIWFLWG